jgi:hypothetical protein
MIGVAATTPLPIHPSMSRIEILARAIASAEGFGRRGAIPTRYHNPGDLKAVRGFTYPGQRGVGKGGHVIFRTDADGYAALSHLINKMIGREGTSRHYRATMTLQQVARLYAGNSRVWVRNVCKELRVTPNVTLHEFLES